MRQIISNAHIIGPESDFTGSVIIENGIIAEVVKTRTYRDGMDINGLWLSPGIVDIHSDYIEREFSPRPNTGFPAEMAYRYLDMRAATSGITTLFNGISFRESLQKNRSIETSMQMACKLEEYIDNKYFLINHYMHARIDVTNDLILEDMDKILSFKCLRIAVYNDHTPGTRQFRDLKKYTEYSSDVSGLSEERLLEIAKEIQGQAAASKHVRPIVSEKLKKAHIIIGSHDDTTHEHVDEAMKDGATFCEFPTTFEAAGYAKEKGVTIAMGAPNLILGKSQSGNISCREAMNKELVDVLCSDYHFPAMLSSALYLMNNGKSPSDALNMITLNPAKTVHMNNKIGSIEKGKRADIVIFDIINNHPLVKQVFVNGKNVFKIDCELINNNNMKSKNIVTSFSGHDNTLVQKEPVIF